MIFNVLGLELTRSCTNRCKYCYGQGRPIIGNMNDDIIRSALLLMDNQPIDSFTITLLGGEPSLRLKTFLPILTNFLKTTDKKVFLTINTNGLLFTQDLCDQLKNFNTHLSISLDGPKQIHDLNRVLTNGLGTYDLLLQKIPLLLTNFPDSLCQSTFTPDTIFQLSDSYFLAKSLGFKEWYWAPDLYNSTWEDKHYKILEEQLAIIAEDYFQQEKILYKGFESNNLQNKGNNRFAAKSHCLLVNPEGILKVSRLSATCIDPIEDQYWFVGDLTKNGLELEKVNKWESRYGENADQLYFAYNSKEECLKCTANKICYNSLHDQRNPYLYMIQCQQPKMQCKQKQLITKFRRK